MDIQSGSQCLSISPMMNDLTAVQATLVIVNPCDFSDFDPTLTKPSHASICTLWTTHPDTACYIQDML